MRGLSLHLARRLRALGGLVPRLMDDDVEVAFEAGLDDLRIERLDEGQLGVFWKPEDDGRVDVFHDGLYRVQLDPGGEFETPPAAEVWPQSGRVHEAVVPLVGRNP